MLAENFDVEVHPPLTLSVSSGSDSQIGTSLSSLPMPDTHCSTQLDLAVLDAPETRKMRDDGKIHHIMCDSMFRPRKKVSTE